MSEQIEGVVEELLFEGEEDGFTVIRLTSGERRLTAVGRLASVVPGEQLRLTGRWTRHPRFGLQFTVDEYESRAPATVDGIERYLGSGLVTGIGEGLARRIVRAFGERTLLVLDEEPERLAEIGGIGKKRVAALREAWNEQRGIRDIMVFLQSHGAGTALAAKIYKRYGDRSISVVRENPYLLSADLAGVGFITADRMARSIGIAADSPARAEAGIQHTLDECSSEGHLYYPRVELIQRCQKLLQIDREMIAAALVRLEERRKVIVEQEDLVYLPAFHRAENGIARFFIERKSASPSFIVDTARALEWVGTRMEITLAEKQIEALRTALERKTTVITGGPGTGKTTILRSLVAVLQREGARLLLAAPTGRAAKRMQDASGHEARTIHRLLEYSPREHAFHRNAEAPLECDWLIIDETSMVDAVLMYHLLKAVPPRSSLVLVGDRDQLPSVGPGRVLADIIDSDVVPVVELREIFRQSEASNIVVNAHRINVGLLPLEQEDGDFFFIRREDPDEVVRLIVRLCTDRIPARFGFDPVEEIQVLSPMHRGAAGVANLNSVLQASLNPSRAEELVHGAQCYRPDDKVMQIRNNYDKEVFNGDIGRILSVDRAKGALTVTYEGRSVRYDPVELDQITLAYAVSVHKSQGCEFPAVILPVLTSHYLLLKRNLLYTAVTRGKRLVVVIGTKKALLLALSNTDTRERFSGLAARLAGRV